MGLSQYLLLFLVKLTISIFYSVSRNSKNLCLLMPSSTRIPGTAKRRSNSLVKAATKLSWELAMTTDTTSLEYWLNWRFLLCSIWVITPMLVASFIIWKKEGPNTSRIDEGDRQQETTVPLFADEAWRPCLEEMHPFWLLGFRIIAFLVLLSILLVDVIVDGFSVFYYYTQWTFTLVTIYFGLGVLLSIHGCYQYWNGVNGVDAEQGAYVAPSYEENSNSCYVVKSVEFRHQYYIRQTAGVWGYIFQVLFQMNAGAVLLTDCVFWFIIFPFLAANDHGLSFLKISTHSINAVFLLGETALNSLRFPWFRIAYFILWTGMFVIFQWIVHACVSIWWPYPFLDLSSDYAPVWYLMVAMLHLPCYGIFSLLIKMKEYLLSRCSSPYQLLR